MQRRRTPLVPGVGVGTGPQQSPDCIHISSGHGPVQRRIALLVLDVGIGTGIQQRVEDLGPQFRQTQRLPATPILNVGIGSGSQQYFDYVYGSLGHGSVQRQLAVSVFGVGSSVSFQ